jgi:hypothetical protein
LTLLLMLIWLYRASKIAQCFVPNRKEDFSE